MSPIDWLEKNASGFSNLSTIEINAIMHFSLLWGLFEGKILSANANANSILSMVHDWHAKNYLDASKFSESLDHFKCRYFSQGQFNSHFRKLNFRKNDNGALVESVLCGNNYDLADSISSIFIIIYRLRNNLFHGIKWEDELKGQMKNFEYANIALMHALDVYYKKL